jgi:hypothetical protein
MPPLCEGHTVASMKETKDINKRPWTDSGVNTAHRYSPLGKEYPKTRVIVRAILVAVLVAAVLAVCGLCRASHTSCDAIPMHPKDV